MRETVARLGVSDAKQAGRVVGEIMKANKGKFEPATVKRMVDEELRGTEDLNGRFTSDRDATTPVSSRGRPAIDRPSASRGARSGIAA